MIHESTSFLMKFINSPKTIGSITPSSSYLADRMLRDIHWDEAQSIVELGAGTGVFTRQIASKIEAGTKVVVFEKDRDMRGKLQSRFPGFYLMADAQDLVASLERVNVSSVDYIISGLPFANFEPKQRQYILDGIMEALKPGGQFVSFQYSLQMKTALLQNFKQVEISMVPFNIPPAFVYHCIK